MVLLAQYYHLLGERESVGGRSRKMKIFEIVCFLVAFVCSVPNVDTRICRFIVLPLLQGIRNGIKIFIA